MVISEHLKEINSKTHGQLLELFFKALSKDDASFKFDLIHSVIDDAIYKAVKNRGIHEKLAILDIACTDIAKNSLQESIAQITEHLKNMNVNNVNNDSAGFCLY